MSDSELQVLSIGPESAERGDEPGYGPIEFEHAAGGDAAEIEALLGFGRYDALVVSSDWDGWRLRVHDEAVLLVRRSPEPAEVLAWLRAGAQDVVEPGELMLPSWSRRLRSAIERQRLLAAASHAYATDLLTGLPHERQLVEHMSHLIALREREPSPMALLVLRVEGLSTTAVRQGADAASTLRRKLAVRLRSGLRASDVVASLAGDSFAALLSSIDNAADAERVADKLRRWLAYSFNIAGQQVGVATAIGVATYPADGTQPAALLQRALALAAAAPATGREGFANWVEGGHRPPDAAND